MIISKKEKIKIINILSMGVVCLLVLVMFCLPKWKSISIYNRDITNLSKAVEILSQIESDPSGFENKKNKIVENLNAIKEKAPQQSMTPQVIEQITRPIKELGISLISITPLESINREKSAEAVEEKRLKGSEKDYPEICRYMEIPIELVLQADYKQFGMYLNRLRHLPRLIVLKEFSIRENTGVTPKLDIKLKISVFNYGKE